MRMESVLSKVLLLGVLMLGLSAFAFADGSSLGSNPGPSGSPTVGSSDDDGARASPSASVSGGSDSGRERLMMGIADSSEKRSSIKEQFRAAIQNKVDGDQRFNRCSQFTDAAQREACFTQEAGIGDLARDKIKCESDDANASACIRGLKEKVLTAWRWRFAHLIDMAGKLNVSANLTADVEDFKVFVQSEALAFENATTSAEKKQIVNDVLAAWKELRAKILREMVEAKIQKAQTGIERALEVLRNLRDKLQERNQTTPGLDNAISRLEANLAKLDSDNVSLSQKWVSARHSLDAIAFAKRSIMRMVNRMPAEEMRESEVEIPKEVEEADDSS